jgi:hypothetical protein
LIAGVAGIGFRHDPPVEPAREALALKNSR